MALSAKKSLGLLRRRGVKLLSKATAKARSFSPPGTPVFVGEQHSENVRLTVIDYSEEQFEERDVEKVEELSSYSGSKTVSWINVCGVHDVQVISDLGASFGLHPLVQEDVANTSQRPKTEDYESHLYLVLRMIRLDEETDEVTGEQVSLILGPGYVVTFQEREGDVFEPIRDRLRNSKGRIRQHGADYLFYALLDAVVDGYFSVLERIGERVEAVEDAVMSDPVPSTLADIHDLRKLVVYLRRSVWPLREAVSALEKTESGLVGKPTRLFMRDAYDHTIQLMDTIEAFRDVASSLFEIHLSMVSNKMNEVMKVLTIIATIFIPITFIAGIYGMNFEHMPELKYPWAYPAVWGVMIATVLVMLGYFRKKNWL